MKKRILCLVIAVFCLLPLTLTGCGDGEAVETPPAVKPLTITLYGITDESTTPEAIQLVQDELNEYTEGTFNTHIILRLYPEAEYYAMIDKTLNDLKYKALTEEAEEEATELETSAPADEGAADTTADDIDDADDVTSAEAETTLEETTEAPVYEYGVYPDEDGIQLDIFMVQGADMMRKYKEAGFLSSLNDALTNSSKLIKDYISAQLLATTNLGGKPMASGLVDKGTYYGIPNNTVVGEYTYLLVNKELASQYYYAADDVKTLDGLADYLSDAVNHSEYVTLYNAPDSPALTIGNSLIGGVPSGDVSGFTRLDPVSLLSDTAYVNYLKNMNTFRNAGYITEGNDDALPVDEEGNETKVAAAFLKGDASLPAEYEDDYYVITYAKPMADADECPGTMFCVSAYAKDVNRCVEVIAALQTKASFRNTFQYGVEDVHYRYDEFTGMITVTSTDYVMDPANTGNLFLLTPNTSMDEKTLALAADNWALAKQQYRDTVFSPYALFDYEPVSEDNYTISSLWYQAERKADYDDKLKEEKAKAKDEGKRFTSKDELAFQKSYTFSMTYDKVFMDEVLAEVEALSATYLARVQAYNVEADGEWQAFIDGLVAEFAAEEAVSTLLGTEHPDSLTNHYNTWYSANGIK